MPKSYYWLIITAVAWIVTYFLVPREKLKRLFTVGFWGGLVLTVIIQYIAVDLLGLWKFNFMLVPILGFPLFLPLIWFAETILFVNYLPETTTGKAISIVAFVAGTTAVNYLLLLWGLQTFIRWNLFYTFVLGIATHILISYFYLVSLRGRRTRT